MVEGGERLVRSDRQLERSTRRKEGSQVRTLLRPSGQRESGTSWRGHGEDAIYFAADKNRYIGAVSIGFGPDGERVRRKVSGKTKQEVRDKLKTLHAELDAGVQPIAGYTVQAAVDDWRAARDERCGC